MSAIPDGRLALVFTCCHPALAAESRVALTLREVGGLTTTEIAHAFLVAEPAKLHQVRPALPAALSTLVERMLAKDPAARPTGAEDA